MFDESKKDYDLWCEKYRPSTTSGYMFKNPTLEGKVNEWIEKGDIPHIGLFGPAGTGKTTLIGILTNALIEKKVIDKFDVIILNMSDEGIDAVRNKIITAAELQPIGAYKVFVLEEMEQMSKKAQASLKTVMEKYYTSSRFILTSNEPNMILTPIRSRIQQITLDKHDKETFITHVIDILQNEGIAIDENNASTIMKYIDSCYPDMRKTLNTIQSSVVNGSIKDMDEAVDSSLTSFGMILDALAAGNIRQMREIIVSNVKDSDVSGFFTFLAKNVDKFTTDEIKQLKIRVAIRDAAVNDTMCADRELNISGLLCEIDLICCDE